MSQDIRKTTSSIRQQYRLLARQEKRIKATLSKHDRAVERETKAIYDRHKAERALIAEPLAQLKADMTALWGAEVSFQKETDHVLTYVQHDDFNPFGSRKYLPFCSCKDEPLIGCKAADAVLRPAPARRGR